MFQALVWSKIHIPSLEKEVYFLFRRLPSSTAPEPARLWSVNHRSDHACYVRANENMENDVAGISKKVEGNESFTP